MRGTGEEPWTAALSVEPRFLTPQDSPSWLRMPGRTGTCMSLLCTKHRDQTEGNIALWLPKGFPVTSGQMAGLHPAGGILAAHSEWPACCIQGNQESADYPRRPRLSVITTDLSKPRGTGQACTDNGENQILPKGLL